MNAADGGTVVTLNLRFPPCPISPMGWGPQRAAVGTWGVWEGSSTPGSPFQGLWFSR